SNKDTIIPPVETLTSISHFEQTLLSNLVNNKDYKSLNPLNVDFLAIKVFFGVANITGIEKIAKKIFETYPAPILELI
ncbi:RimK-like ATPgrasp N-terminal domain-containing protein, partial [Francisella tularensis subsp. holarctica]|uniref:RimK-like ATPgrasp N-terminal domain-containing protein n=1 Tax=Francisella tularensis TaxID=263 RepID=UPI0023819A03